MACSAEVPSEDTSEDSVRESTTPDGSMQAGPPSQQALSAYASPQTISTKMARATIRTADTVARVVTRFMVAYTFLCLIMLRQLARRHVCSETERKMRQCVWPKLPLRIKENLDPQPIDFFLISSPSIDPKQYRSASVAYARLGWSSVKSFDASTTVAIPAVVRQQAAAMVGHLYARTARDEKGNETAESVINTSTLLGSVMLTRELQVQRREVYRNLLGDKPAGASSFEHGAWWPHWRFSVDPFTLRVLDVGEDGALSRANVLNGLPHLGIEHFDVERQHGEFVYLPAAFVDEQSVLARNALPLSRNISTKSPTLRFQYRPSSPLVYALRNTVSRQLIDMADNLMNPADADDLRFHLSDRRIFRYVVSQAIGVAHLFFDYLAFREDVGFYVGRETFRGVSTSSLLWNLARSFVVLLYLIDNDASRLVLISIARSVLTELFKVWRVLQPRFSFAAGGIPILHVRRPDSMDMDERYTVKLDKFCTKHLGVGLAPLAVGFSFYALVYDVHKSKYARCKRRCFRASHHVPQVGIRGSFRRSLTSPTSSASWPWCHSFTSITNLNLWRTCQSRLAHAVWISVTHHLVRSSYTKYSTRSSTTHLRGLSKCP